MHSMVLEAQGQDLVPRDLPTPEPGEHELLIRVRACGICRTDLHVIDGDLKEPNLPLVLGHEIVGEVAALGAAVEDVEGFQVGDRVGLPWLGYTCGNCSHCAAGRENLCTHPGFTGYQRDGGFAEHTIADAKYCFRIPDGFDNLGAESRVDQTVVRENPGFLLELDFIAKLDQRLPAFAQGFQPPLETDLSSPPALELVGKGALGDRASLNPVEFRTVAGEGLALLLQQGLDGRNCRIRFNQRGDAL